jgi:tetratricopeptide (TPR) repeat protein
MAAGQTAREKVILTWAEPLPEGTNTSTLLARFAAGLTETDRFESVATPEEASALLYVEAAPSTKGPLRGMWLLRATLQGADGAVREQYAISTDPKRLDEVAWQVGLQFAPPELYRERMRAAGAVGRVLHPSELALDLREATSLALSSALDGPPAELRERATQMARIATHTGELDPALHAADLLALEGDFVAARAVLSDATRRARTNVSRKVAARSHGLAAHELLGDELAAMLFCAGWCLGLADKGGTFSPPMAPAVALDIIAAVSHVHGCAWLQSRRLDDALEAAAESFGRYLGAMAAAGAELAQKRNERSVLTALPYLRRLEAPPAGESSKRAAPALIELAFKAVRWRRWRLLTGRSVGALASASRNDPTFVEAAAWRAALVSLTQPFDAESQIAEVLDALTAPHLRAEVIALRAAMRTDRGDPAQALNDFDAALELDPWCRVALLSRPMCLARLGRHDEALRALTALASVSPGAPQLPLLRGWILLDAARHDDALPPLAQATEKTPDDPHAWGNHGICLRHLGRRDESLASLDRAVKLQPNLAPVRFHRGMLLGDMGRNNDAREDLTWVASQLPPESAQAKDAAAWLARVFPGGAAPSASGLVAPFAVGAVVFVAAAGAALLAARM